MVEHCWIVCLNSLLWVTDVLRRTRGAVKDIRLQQRSGKVAQKALFVVSRLNLAGTSHATNHGCGCLLSTPAPPEQQVNFAK
jgi:hypothetical protein